MIKYSELKCILEKNNNIPYPGTPKLPKSPKYAKLVYDSYAGCMGELTAITQYIYEQITLNYNKDISKILLDISIQEMKHLDILGKIIVSAGSKPVYTDSNGICWNSKNVNSECLDIEKIMKTNIKAEEEAINGYINLKRYTNNITLRKIYDRIILDEKTHKEVFEKILKTYKA